MATAIKNLMLDLKLLGMLQSYSHVVDSAVQQGFGIQDALEQLLQAEHDWRLEKKTERLIKTSKLATKPLLEDFDFTVKRTIQKSQVADLYKLKWLNQGRPIIIIGPTGVGKTFLAEALAHHACHHRHSTLFVTMSTFLENLLLARSSNSYLKFRSQMAKPTVLVLDDFGLRKLSALDANDLNDVLKERYGSKSIIITTQLPMNHWGEVIEDPVIADTIIDQLTHSALKITLEGETYRKVKAQKLD